ncbi:uncharacterized protein [Lolium perenne]|uniref:uncharacterized protein isoform X2 n=1 Tax=Lolium perenne TaxID=4522 RepID=UPI003A99BD1B
MQFGRSRQSWRSRHQCHRRTSVYHGCGSRGAKAGAHATSSQAANTWILKLAHAILLRRIARGIAPCLLLAANLYLEYQIKNKRFVKIWEFRSTDKKILYSLHFIAVDQQR